MTVNELTCTEINEAIAQLRGEWQYAMGGGITTPDYCYDWAAAGPCLAEMVHASSMDVSIWRGPKGCHCAPTIYEHDIHGHGAEIPEAIARAYHAWRVQHADAEEPQP